jgi:release factor glutamine methyltransferase
VRIITLPGVLRPPSDCRLLADVMRERGLARNRSVLDVFTGTGALAIAAARDGARAVSAVDISWRATWNARLNARLNGVRVRALRGDLFAPVGGERFDLVLANPPYVPGSSAELPAGGPARAWEGGLDGRALIDRLCAEVAGHLTAAGVALIVHSSLCGELATIDRLAAAGLGADVLARRRGPLGPIVAARAQLLESRGLLEPGEREEELVVIQAARSGS